MIDPTKTICIECNSHPKLHDGQLDSDFYACECKGIINGIEAYRKVIYYGWDLPESWKIPIDDDFLNHVKNSIGLYEQFNESRDDDLIYHTDCLADFIEFLEKNRIFYP